MNLVNNLFPIKWLNFRGPGRPNADPLPKQRNQLVGRCILLSLSLWSRQLVNQYLLLSLERSERLRRRYWSPIASSQASGWEGDNGPLVASSEARRYKLDTGYLIASSEARGKEDICQRLPRAIACGHVVALESILSQKTANHFPVTPWG